MPKMNCFKIVYYIVSKLTKSNDFRLKIILFELPAIENISF